MLTGKRDDAPARCWLLSGSKERTAAAAGWPHCALDVTSRWARGHGACALLSRPTGHRWVLVGAAGKMVTWMLRRKAGPGTETSLHPQTQDSGPRCLGDATSGPRVADRSLRPTCTAWIAFHAFPLVSF